jgi:superfamily I DNA/RNA helicase
LNFHSWCKRLCQEHNYEKEYKQLWRELFNDGGNATDKEDLLDRQLPKLVSSIIDNDTLENVKSYDAILVDEGQDFRPNWWNVLRNVCKEEGEKLLVADKTQDIYGTARAWTDEAMKGAGFSGNWSTLEVSYRLPPQLIDHAQFFAKQFLPNDLVDLPISPQLELEIYPCQLRWVQTNEEQAVECCVQEILKMPPLANRDILAIPDITFLVDRKDIGLEVITTLGKKRHKMSAYFRSR